MKDPNFIIGILQKEKDAAEKAMTAFHDLSIEQLNWKPDEHSWSIAQCLDHLIVCDSLYFPKFENIIKHDHAMNWWEKWSPFSGFFGHMLVSQVSEQPKKKLKAPKVFAPVSSGLDAGITDRFRKHLETLLSYTITLGNVDIDKTHLTSPVSGFVTFSIRNALLLLVQHEHRHINQAIRVKQRCLQQIPHL